MCNLCSINHFVEDDLEWQDDEPSLCVHQASHVFHLDEKLDNSSQTQNQVFVSISTPILQGSSF